VPAGSAGPFTPRTSADEPRNRPEAGAREKAESYEEGDRLDRQWEGAAAEIEGVTAPPPLHWGLTKDAGHVSRAGDVPNEILFDFKYKLDPAAKPKAIDLIPEEGPAKGKTLQGIYSLQRDELKVCFVSPNIPDPENQKRPGEFSAKKGSGYVLLVFRPDVLDEAVLSRAGFDKEELEFVRGVLAVVREERLMYFPKELKERWAKDMGKEERLARVESIAAKLDSLGKLPAAVIHPVDARIAGMRAPPVLEGATWHNAARPLGWKDLKGKVVLLDFM